jgi:hypothetical protein
VEVAFIPSLRDWQKLLAADVWCLRDAYVAADQPNKHLCTAPKLFLIIQTAPEHMDNRSQCKSTRELIGEQ